MIRLGNNEVLKTLTKTLTFVDNDANANANADAGGSTIALPERCSGEQIRINSFLVAVCVVFCLFERIWRCNSLEVDSSTIQPF